MKSFTLIVLLFIQTLAYATNITVGVLKFAPPFSDSTGNGRQFFGFTVDLMNAVCTRLQVKCVYYPFTLGQQFSLLDKGLVDVILIPQPITPNQSDQYIFSLPYLVSAEHFLALSSSPLHNLKDIKDIRIGVIESTSLAALQSTPYYEKNRVVIYKTITDLIAALLKKDVDSVFINDKVANYLSNNLQPKLKIVGSSIPVGEGYGVMALRNKKLLIEQINQQLLSMESDGTYVSLYEQYFTF